VTQPAVSRAIGGLEEHLGVKLFKRRGRWIEVTPSGEMLFRATATAFAAMTNALHELDSTSNSRETISLSLSTASASHWLIPRMSEFRAVFPDVELVFQLFSGEGSGSVHNVDLGLRLANPQEGDLHRWPFCNETIMALCSKGYLEQMGSIDQPVPNTTHTLIRLDGQHYKWTDYFNASGVDPGNALTTLAFSDYATVLQAAVAGQGVALGWVTATARLVIDGVLVPACPSIVSTGRRYHLVASNRRPIRPIVAEIRDWLIEQIKSDLKTMASIL